MDKIVSARPLPDFLLELVFSDGLEKTVDLRPFIGAGLLAALQDPDYFCRVAVESGGGICWPNGYDFCPNFLRDHVPAVELAPA